jgi:hypothetical protein
MSSSPIAVLVPHGPVTSVAPVAVTDLEQPGLLAALAAVPDPRDPRGVRYPLASLLAVAVCAVTFAAIADWVRDLDPPAWTRLGFTSRIPVASTVWRLLVPRRRATAVDAPCPLAPDTPPADDRDGGR